MTRVRWDADEALTQLYAAHWRSLVRLAALLVHDLGTAEEVTQDAFVAVHGRWRRLRDPDRALAYLRRSVVNGSRSVLRHRAVAQRHLAGQQPHVPQPGPDAPVELRLRREAVRAALLELPRRQREVVALRYYADLSEAEIADLLGISRGSVKSHASRAAATLRDRLDQLWEDRP